MNELSGRAKIVVFILDSESKSIEHKFWEYVCDNVIQMDADSQEGYYIRTIEIIKARYQQHVLGKQVFKIFPALVANGQNIKGDLIGVAPRHTHPYRKEGGLFIYPSIHYYLSRYKRHLLKPEDTNQVYAKTYPNELNNLVAPERGLMPEGRCTAFLGVRGGHKSHLGYLHLLYRMIEWKESAIIVSLRDDEAMTRKSMGRILEQQPELITKAKQGYPNGTTVTESRVIRDLEKDGRLQILYYHPGYITPEEFCHRMLVSVKHIKRDGEELVKKDKSEGGTTNWNKTTLLFNSLDQIPSRFPLCAKQDIFVPGLVDVLNGEEVTSIFVAVETPDQPITQYGLLPMADLVLSFKPFWFEWKQYLDFLSSNNQDQSNSDMHEAIVLQVQRFAGGEMAGAKGILELVPSQQSELFNIYDECGLHFTPLNRNWYPQNPKSYLNS
jgi:hypothetical protein